MTNKRFINMVYRGPLIEICRLSKSESVTVAVVLDRDKGYRCFDKISVGEMLRCGEGGPQGYIEDIRYDDEMTLDVVPMHKGVVFISANIKFLKNEILDWCEKGFEEVEK